MYQVNIAHQLLTIPIDPETKEWGKPELKHVVSDSYPDSSFIYSTYTPLSNTDEGHELMEWLFDKWLTEKMACRLSGWDNRIEVGIFHVISGNQEFYIVTPYDGFVYLPNKKGQ